MTGMLASVNSLEEAVLALTAEVDIIDLKQPASGALGALEFNRVRQIYRFCDGQRPVSATVGDLPMQPDLVFDAVRSMSETGVDYIKIGFFPGGDWRGTVQKLATLSAQNCSLIAVLLADAAPDFAIVDTLKTAGFKGVMLDTMEKHKGSLTDVMTPVRIQQFVIEVKSRQMLCGLAGSLKLKDIPFLTACRPDYLGFRGALCVQGERTAQLDHRSISAIKHAIVAANAQHPTFDIADAAPETAH